MLDAKALNDCFNFHFLTVREILVEKYSNDDCEKLEPSPDNESPRRLPFSHIRKK